jgi:hypothetical protein
VQLDAREALAEALVDAVAEGDVLRGVAADVEAVWIRETPSPLRMCMPQSSTSSSATRRGANCTGVT